MLCRPAPLRGGACCIMKIHSRPDLHEPVLIDGRHLMWFNPLPLLQTGNRHAEGPRRHLRLLRGILVLCGWCLLIGLPSAAHGSDPDTLWTDTEWTSDSSPYNIGNSLVVAPGATLTIEPGVRVNLEPDVSIVAMGGLHAVGDSLAPIEFRRQDPVQPWGAIVAYHSTRQMHLEHCIIEGGSTWGTYEVGFVAALQGSLKVASCELYNTPTEIIHTSDNSVLDIRDSYLHHGLYGLRLSFGCTGDIVGNTIRDLTGDAMNIDYCDLQVIGNYCKNCEGDGIDFDSSNGFVAYNQVYDVGDAGLTFSWGTYITIINNLVCRARQALEVKNGQTILVVNCTFVESTFGMRLHELFAGDGGGTAYVRNCIVWGNETPIYADELSFIEALYSDIEGDSVFPGAGNINADPLFFQPGADDFRLSGTSPCIDAATSNGAAPEDDFEEQLRWDDPNTPNTGSGTYPYYDIGCDEYYEIGTSHVDGARWESRLQLSPPSPNPSRGPATVMLELDRAQSLRIAVIGVDGRLLRVLGQRSYPAGRVPVVWDGRNRAGERVAAGRYQLVVEDERGRQVTHGILRLR
ncbi:MAG: hypothetical protein GF355_05350 [Candidatus Eisenbacteria bacterium]|nr:hypothetical protein [Candidatus Eisenbacteria bacterium]